MADIIKETIPVKKDVPAFLKEFVGRFALKTPKFFQIFQTAGLIVASIGTIPDVLNWLDVTPTGTFSKVLTTVLKVAGGITWVMAKLPVQNSTIVMQTTNELPFTEKKVEAEDTK